MGLFINLLLNMAIFLSFLWRFYLIIRFLHGNLIIRSKFDSLKLVRDLMIRKP